MKGEFVRFFTPNKILWKYAKKNQVTRSSFKDDKIDHIVDNSTELLDFAISFTKTVVRLSFVLFIIVNLYVLTMTTINYCLNRELLFIDTLITESYSMLRDVIAAYIIKAATENSLRIAFSVISDYLEKKYDIKPVEPIIPNNYDPEEYDNGIDSEESIDYTDEPIEEEDPESIEESDIEIIDDSIDEEDLEESGIEEINISEKPIVEIIGTPDEDAYQDAGIDLI